jgi:transcriptional regulator GlxA family with amidase domain
VFNNDEDAMHDDIKARYARVKTLQIGILVFPEVEVLDFAGPFEVFSVAARIAARVPGAHAPFAVSLIGAAGGAVQARHGMGVVPHAGFDSAPALDLLVVPGGIVDQPLADPATLAWIRRQHAGAALTASVCTGAFILAKLGLLDGLAVTTHWEDIAELRAAHPGLDVRAGAPWVDQGRIVTSAGISAGIGMSLHLVGRILGEDMARATARQMEFDWAPRQNGMH